MSSIKIRTKRFEGKTQIRTLITHPMETGRSKDPKTNQPIPAHFIRELKLSHNGKAVMNCQVGMSISKDPYFAFMLKGGEPGDQIKIEWVDNLGNKDSEEHVLK
ncbi:thiosulfate oxidation carrier complex protein SoxZ [Candidatus Methylomicrobium oryzae]|jgi:sulfur-oxidizing protein SoxZ|uniref:thiosulfate oxidation carrier complex protein SoxZ n=1 Tax=Candidatus Methylomicrobium oryzae TaxID=2802053 RepID=UPI001923A345|nr:thiosulfate oxidation carrier complex protein SoxZ [Methylomicrobium sp. RS1]MBL1264190.1 thiosulfate oxidation carrier complex protein SoxZ [Methylomicrobium sp. RS1]